ncbi:hypothetical protein SLP22_0076 [Salmonella phage BAU.Micro_SLP-22]|jgi:hypothetical protein|nr:hypothetical protein SLP22_00004 [Salmonella phage BAU.Micro_SLP-22]
MTGSAGRAAVKFIGIGGIALFWGLALAYGSQGGIFRPFLYTVACGVCVVMLWPNQADGDALINRGNDDGA